MPVMDGWEAIRCIRETPDLTDVPVVAVTAHEIDGKDWRKAGFSAYLSKLCEPRRLLDTVRGLLPPPSVDP